MEKEHLPPANHPERATASQIMDDLLTVALAHAPAPAKPKLQKSAGKEPKERGRSKKAKTAALGLDGPAGAEAGGAGASGGPMFALPAGAFMYPGVYMCPAGSANCPGYAGTKTSCLGCSKLGAVPSPAPASASGWPGPRVQGALPLGMLVGPQGVAAREGDMLMEDETYVGGGATGKQPEGVVYNNEKGVMYPAALQRLLEGP